jgi:hypothetical protein
MLSWAMKLITQPADSIQPIITAVRKARRSIKIAIFRCDLKALEKELASAVTRGVVVHALVAHTNAGGAKGLRALELRLLEAGVTVARTDDDLVRYHQKLLLIDRRTLYVLGFNFTSVDVRSRSFGIATSASSASSKRSGRDRSSTCGGARAGSTSGPLSATGPARLSAARACASWNSTSAGKSA